MMKWINKEEHYVKKKEITTLAQETAENYMQIMTNSSDTIKLIRIFRN